MASAVEIVEEILKVKFFSIRVDFEDYVERQNAFRWCQKEFGPRLQNLDVKWSNLVEDNKNQSLHFWEMFIQSAAPEAIFYFFNEEDFVRFSLQWA